MDGWTARPDLNTFTRGDEVVRVEPKVMELFVRLARSPGTVVSKAEILESVWAGVVVGEDSLTRVISELRRALGDDARKPRIVETISKRGYRLVAPVSFTPVGAASIVPDAQPGSVRPPPASPPSADRPAARRLVAVGVLIITLGALVAWAWPWTLPAPVKPALVLVGPFENSTGLAGLDETVIALVEQEIARDERLAMVPETRLRDVLARMRRPADEIPDLAVGLEVLTRDRGIAALVTGRVTRVGRDIGVVVELSDAAGEPISTFSVQGADERALRTTLASAARFHAVLGRRPAGGKTLPPVTTSSLEALRLFAQAVEVIDANWASIDGPWELVIEKLQEALRLDPEFAMAKIWLAMIIRTADTSRLAFQGGEPIPPLRYREPAQDSLALAEGVSRPEQLFIRGAASTLLEHPREALAALENLLSTTPEFSELQTRKLLAELYFSKGDRSAGADQALAIAAMLPDDFDALAEAGQHLVTLPGGFERARPYVARARALLTPQAGQRENSTWRASWVLHFQAFEQWAAGDYAATVESLEAIDDTLTAQTGFMRDSLTTTSGLFWLSLGRIAKARQVFELGVDSKQRELNLSRIADLFDDRETMVRHLQAMSWSHSPVAYARLGMFDRARAIVAGGYGTERERRHVQALELAASGRFADVVTALQVAVDVGRGRPGSEFYDTSITLAEMWERSGSPSQAIRVLEEAVATGPVHIVPGPACAWWIRAQVRLIDAYRRAGRPGDARGLEQRVRKLLSFADPDHPFFRELAEPALARR